MIPAVYPYLSEFPYKYSHLPSLKSDKVLLMLRMSLLSALGLIALSIIFTLLLTYYVTNHRSNSVIPGWVVVSLFAILFFNMMYSLGIFYLSSGSEDAYNHSIMITLYMAFAFIGIQFIMLLTIMFMMGAGGEEYKQTFIMLILPAILEWAIYFPLLYGFAYLYKKTKLVWVPIQSA